MEKEYVIVINNEIVSTPAPLPNNYKNISNLFALSDDQLSDLSWSGNNEGFWVVNSDPLPTITIEQKIDTSYSLNTINKTCHRSYTVVNVTPSEEEIRKNRIKSDIRMIRDQYLLITDFTQLSDAPISDAAKLDFRNFRQQLRVMLDIPDITQAVWPTIPTSASNITIPPFPPMPSFNG
jgi:hypothetical protein